MVWLTTDVGMLLICDKMIMTTENFDSSFVKQIIWYQDTKKYMEQTTLTTGINLDNMRLSKPLQSVCHKLQLMSKNACVCVCACQGKTVVNTSTPNWHLQGGKCSLLASYWGMLFVFLTQWKYFQRHKLLLWDQRYGTKAVHTFLGVSFWLLCVSFFFW